MTRDEAIQIWEEANYERCCNCHLCPPCSFCVDGYSLPLEEYLERFEFEEDNNDMHNAYERAMSILE